MDTLSSLIDTFNGREKALVAWIVVALVYMLGNSKTRTTLIGVTKAFLNIKVLVPYLATLTYLILSINFLRTFGIWDFTLLKDTVFWFLGTATVLFLNTNKASQNPLWFKKMLLEVIAFTVFVEFLANLYSFPFLLEFLILPFIFLVVATSAFADIKDEYKAIRKPLKVIIAGYGLFVLYISVSSVFKNLTTTLTIHNLLTLVVPSILTIMYLPFIYIFALIMAYEMLFIRLGIFIKDKQLLRFTKWEVIKLNHFNLFLLNRISKGIGRELTKVENKQDVLTMLINAKRTK